MPDETVVPIAPIPLARSRPRLLIPPALLLLTGALAIAGGALVGGYAGIGLALAGGLVVLLAIYLALVVVTVRLDVEVSALRLRWLGSDRTYQLVRGRVTRVPVRGPGRVRLRSRFGAFGWGLGPARLRRGEPIQLVRLARSDALILIPTDAGRVAVAPQSEDQLISALTAAARVQQRLDEVAARARAVTLPPPPESAPEEPRPAPREADMKTVLTGIERVLLEERLAAERAAALARAEEERRAAEQEAARLAALAASAAPQTEPGPAVAVPSEERRRPGLRVRLPRPSLPLPPRGTLGRSQLLPYLLPALPLLAALGVWSYASLSGRLDLAEAELGLASVALALAGPAGALGALAVRAWFPRLLGPVSVTSLCAVILIGRALVL